MFSFKRMTRPILGPDLYVNVFIFPVVSSYKKRLESDGLTTKSFRWVSCVSFGIKKAMRFFYNKMRTVHSNLPNEDTNGQTRVSVLWRFLWERFPLYFYTKIHIDPWVHLEDQLNFSNTDTKWTRPIVRVREMSCYKGRWYGIIFKAPVYFQTAH